MFDPSLLGLSIFDDIDYLTLTLYMKLDRLPPEELYPPTTTDIRKVLLNLSVRSEAALTSEKTPQRAGSSMQRFGGEGFSSPFSALLT